MTSTMPRSISDDDHRISSRFDEDEEEEVTLTSDDDDHGVDDRDDDEARWRSRERTGMPTAPVVAAGEGFVYTPPASPSAGTLCYQALQGPGAERNFEQRRSGGETCSKEGRNQKARPKKAAPVKAAAKKATPKKGCL